MTEDRYKDGFLVPRLSRVVACLMRVLPMGWLGCVWTRFEKPSASDTERYVGMGIVVRPNMRTFALVSAYRCRVADCRDCREDRSGHASNQNVDPGGDKLP
jgi:hypothetical protein